MGALDDDALRALRVDAVAIPLHGARAEVHEWVARGLGEPDPSFGATLRTLDASLALGLKRVVYTRLTRSNARVLGELPSLLKARRVALFIVVVPRPEGEAWTSVVPRFGLAVPSALAALERARALGVDARIAGAPRCVLGPYADRALPSAERAYADVCKGCPSREICPGVDETYLSRFGAEELRQAARIDPAPSPLFERFEDFMDEEDSPVRRFRVTLKKGHSDSDSARQV